MNFKMTSYTGLTVCLCMILAGTAKADENLLHMAIGDPARKDKEVELRLDGISDTATGRDHYA